MLQRENAAYATVDRVPQPGLGLVSDGDDRLATGGLRHVQQQLRRVAGAENLVDGGEPRRPLLGAEVGREDAVPRALPPQELARPAR